MKLTQNDLFQTHILKTLEDTHSFAQSLVDALPEKAIVLFFGELGAGKTTLIKAMAEVCGIPPLTVTSPTFSLLHIYEGTRKIFHFDLFRLSNMEDFTSRGFYEFFAEKALFLIEWPERIHALSLRGPVYQVRITALDNEERLIEVSA